MAQSTIRFIKKEELEQLVALCTLHAEFEKSDYVAEKKAELLNKYLFSETPTLFCLVVELENKIVGYATYTKQFSTWDAGFYIYMDCLFMTSNTRGMGLGEQLVNRIKEEANGLDCSLIQWQTPSFNTRGMKFYKRIGANSKSKERYFLDVN